MSRYDTMFSRCGASGALVPFVMLGDPSPALTLAVVDALVDGGADALELGIPFSDPVADGPVIQRAAARALGAGTTPQLCFAMIAEIRSRHPRLPLGVLGYANTAARAGVARFYRAAADAGVDSVLLADVPMTESRPFNEAARAAGVAPVVVVPPSPSAHIIERAAAAGGAYVYLQGRPGVTGTATPMAAPDAGPIQRLRAAGAAPSLVGFGVSRREHFAAALDAGAAGVIVGSAVVEIIERLSNEPDRMAAALGTMLRDLRPSTAPQDRAPVTAGASASA